MVSITEPLVKALRKGEVVWDTDPPGFGVRVLASGRVSFLFDYRVAGRRRRMTIGPWPTWRVERARKRARSLKVAVDEGLDPFDGPIADATFEEAVDDYHRRFQVGVKRNRSADNVRHLLRLHCAAWLNRRIDAISARDVRTLLERMRDGGRPVAANKTFGLLKTCFRWCASPSIGYIDRSPLDGAEKPSDHASPPPRPYSADEIGALWRAAATLGVYERAYLRVLLLVAKRKQALAAMRRDEIGRDGWWRMADAAMPEDGEKKLNMPIPLPDAALRIIRNLPREDGNPYVFVGRSARRGDRRGEPTNLCPGSDLQAKIREASGVADYTYHAVRDTAATRLKTIGAPGGAARRYLDHAQTNDAHERAYTALDELAEATEDVAEIWGRYVTLCARRRTWAKVSAHLDALDVAEGDARRRAGRERRREFYGLLQAGGAAWTRWVRSIVAEARRKDRPTPAAARERFKGRPRLRVVGGAEA
jgi:hypothetical protein